MAKNHQDEEFLFKEECFILTEIAEQIHRDLGFGLHDSEYKLAFESKLKYHGFDYEAQKKFAFNFNGIILQHKFYADFVIKENIIVEIKSVPYRLNDYDLKVFEQLILNKPKAGLVINFTKKNCTLKRSYYWLSIEQVSIYKRYNAFGCFLISNVFCTEISY